MTITFIMTVHRPVCMERFCSYLTDIHIWYLMIFWRTVKKNISSWLYLTQFFLEWKMFQTKILEKIKKKVSCSIFFLNHATNAILWKNEEQRGIPQMTILRMCMAYWITNATDTCSIYVIFVAIPLHQCLYERASSLRYTLHCLLSFTILVNQV